MCVTSYHYNLPKSLESYSQEIGRAVATLRRRLSSCSPAVADVPVLENFAYGDTPTRAAVTAVSMNCCGRPGVRREPRRSVRAARNVRLLVLRTLLTYLELLGVVRQGTPFYAAYEAKPIESLEAIFARLSGEPRQFIQRVFSAAKKGRIWYSLDPSVLALALSAERERVVRALHYLEEHGAIELRTSEPRLRFTRVSTPGPTDALVASCSTASSGVRRRK